MLICKTKESVSTKVEFSIAIYLSLKYARTRKNNNNNTSNNNAVNNSTVCVVFINHLDGDPNDFQTIRNTIVNESNHQSIFTGLPEWAINKKKQNQVNNTPTTPLAVAVAGAQVA